MRDLFEEIWSNIRRNKLRTALTGFAVAWGIFMLIFLLGAGNGLIHALESNNSDYMTNTMNVWGGYTSKPYNGMREGRNNTHPSEPHHKLRQGIHRQAGQRSQP